MKKNLLIALIALLISFQVVVAQTTFKAMFYNVLNYPLQGPSDRLDNLQLIINDYRPDIFMVCELNNEQGADDILINLQTVNSNYQRATFVENVSDDDFGNQNDLQNMLYYDRTKFILESQSEIPTNIRDFNYYTLKINSVDQISNPVVLHVIISHLKSSSGTSNQALRLEMVNELVAFLETLPSDSYVLFGGDLNFYTSSEDGFEELTDATNNITFIDPADRVGSWHNNTNYLDVFTQSTRTQTGLGGATGGFDDRFDFILTSSNMQTNSELFYVDGTYSVYGNNNESNCYNQEINSVECAGTEFDQTIRNALYFMSDHLPVTLTLETSESLSLNEFEISKLFEIKGSNIISSKLQLNIEPLLLKSKYFTLYNSLGQTIRTYNIANLNFREINVSKLTMGIYYVALSNNEIAPLKFIKN